MSIILALDASTDACSVALYRNGDIRSLFEIASKSHTQRLLPMVDELLAATDLRVHELDAIAFGRGPGSFTGLRICAGIVQGLAFGAELPVVPISTLAAMALHRLSCTDQISVPVLAALDARMDEVYAGVYRAHPEQLVELIGEEQVIKPALLAEQLAGQSLIGVGSGWNYPELARLTVIDCQLDYHPRAEEIAILGAVAFGRGDWGNAQDAQPVYLRDTVSWQKRQRIRQSDASL